ncbi:BCCT family transporter [Cellulosimicrobium cellulans]|uniref:BCCT family transporter n=1 Tax=Cellulosimicrobium cellulans TaxID=1710 RepID=UPI0024052829|nr:BCCT family transporter [Cellulosimicrobium cellulans]MDF9875797.1 choline/glycine/proline betaine transport protein [Cellulosimicrobium cellulans]
MRTTEDGTPGDQGRDQARDEGTAPLARPMSGGEPQSGPVSPATDLGDAATDAGPGPVAVAASHDPDAPRTGRPDPRVFYPAAGIILLFVLATILFTDSVTALMDTLQRDVIGVFGWYYVIVVAGFVVFSLWMGLSRFGDIVLGKDEDEPLFRLPVWFAMLFATGMGIGLVYWGVAEPLSHYVSPKPGVEGSDAALAQAAMGQSYLHWGIHAWAIYVVAGLALAYAIHRKGRPVSIRWALEPLFGDRVKGRLGDVIDVVAIIGTVFGVATSLGFGVLQIAAGLGYLDVVEPSTALEIGLIAAITALATISVVSGLGKGIKWLSNGNMVLAGVVLVLVLALGPTLFLLREWVQSLGYYLQNVVRLTFDTTAFQGEAGLEWQSSWTIFYWGWWISWAPFVGVFIARISRGRTVREFVLGTLLVPTLVTTLWFSVFGGSALFREMAEPGSMLVDGEVDTDTALFQLFDGLPLGGLLTVAGIVLIVVFFVTSSDSGSLVVDMLASGGNPNPPTWSRIFWAGTSGLLAIALLLAGGLEALQTAAILIALPFSVVMIGMAVSTVRALRVEHAAILRAERRAARAALTEHVTTRVTESISEQWEELYPDRPERWRALARFPRRAGGARSRTGPGAGSDPRHGG